MALSAWCGYKDIFEVLMNHGADLDMQDTVTWDTVYSVQNTDKAVTMLHEILHEDATIIWYCEKFNIDTEDISNKGLHEMHSYLLKRENKEGYSTQSSS